jgi:hypothetical protein
VASIPNATFMTITQASPRSAESGTIRRLDSFKELKVRYEAPLTQLLDIFPHWTEEDLVAALSDLKGDLEMVIDRISEGIRVLE